MTQQSPRSGGTVREAVAGAPVGGGGGSGALRTAEQAAIEELGQSLRQIVQTAARQSADLRAAVAQADRLRVQMQAGEQSQQENLALAAEALKRIEQRARDAEGMLEQARNVTPSAEEFERRAEELVSRRLASVESKLEAMVASAVARADSAERRIREASEALERRIEELGRSEAAKVEPALERLERLVRRAETLTMDVRREDEAGAGGASQPLGLLVKRAEALTEQTAYANRQFEAVRKQADQARSILGESLNDMCTMIDRLSERAEGLRAEAERAKRTAAEVGKEIDERAERARAGMEGHTRAIEELGLGVRTAEETAEELRRLLGQLEPWESLVRAGTSAEDVPGPVRDLIARGQEAARRELAGIAEALRLAAGRIEGEAGAGALMGDREVTVKAVRREHAEPAVTA